MIYIDEDQLEQVEYLLEQSAQGNHVLFDTETVRRVFAAAKFPEFLASEEDEAEAYAVEHHIEKLMTEPDFDRKRAYLEGLDEATFEKVVRTYFNIVENNLYDSLETPH